MRLAKALPPLKHQTRNTDVLRVLRKGDNQQDRSERQIDTLIAIHPIKCIKYSYKNSVHIILKTHNKYKNI